MSKISLIGSIGSGKTTLLELYSNTIDPIQTAYEPFLNNLDNYYNGNISAFEFQLYVITKLCERNRTYNKNDVLMERNIEDAVEIFTNVLTENKKITPAQQLIIYILFQNTIDKRLKSNFFIYLRTDPQVCFERINQRGRGCEKNITIEYLTQLHEHYERYTDELATTYGTNKIIILNGNLQSIDLVGKLMFFIDMRKLISY
jgi:deoxyadenosine/deoxycytidine kinase